MEAIIVPGNSFSFCSISFKKDTTFYNTNLMNRMCIKTLI